MPRDDTVVILTTSLFRLLTKSWVGIDWSPSEAPTARLAQSVERKALNLVVVGSSPTVGVFGHRVL